MTTSRGEEPTRSERRFAALPESPRLEDTVGTVEADDVPDPHGGRNVDQHRALRDD